MFKFALVAATGMALFAALPAQATDQIFDTNVYATNNAHISGGSYGDIAAGSFSNANGPTGTNFSSLTGSTSTLTNQAHSISQAYAAAAATGALTTGQYTPGDATLTGTQNGVNIFNIDGATYSRLYALTFAGLGSGAVVNISGLSFSNFVNINFGSLSADQVLFNFYDATTVYMGGMNIAGSILAPNARVQLQGGSVAGSVVSDSFYSEGTTIGGRGFIGSPAVTAVPELSTWAMMIAGFGMIGFAVRRRGRAKAGVAHA